MMQIAVYIDAANMFIWFLAYTGSFAGAHHVDPLHVENMHSRRRARSGEGLDAHLRYEANLSTQFIPHGWDPEDIEAQTLAVQIENLPLHPTAETPTAHLPIQYSILPELQNSLRQLLRLEAVGTPLILETWKEGDQSLGYCICYLKNCRIPIPCLPRGPQILWVGRFQNCNQVQRPRDVRDVHSDLCTPELTQTARNVLRGIPAMSRPTIYITLSKLITFPLALRYLILYHARLLNPSLSNGMNLQRSV
jgi:hypothetical protein